MMLRHFSRRRGIYRGRPALSSLATWRGSGKLRPLVPQRREALPTPKPRTRVLHKILRFSDFPAAVLEPDCCIQPDWIAAPCSLHGFSYLSDRSNFDALTARLDEADPDGANWDTVIWDHFASKWLEVIFVAPDSACARVCADARDVVVKKFVLDKALYNLYKAEDDAARATEPPKTTTPKNGAASASPWSGDAPFVDSYGCSWELQNGVWKCTGTTKEAK